MRYTAEDGITYMWEKMKKDFPNVSFLTHATDVYAHREKYIAELNSSLKDNIVCTK